MEHNKYDFIINLLEDKKLSPILKDKLLSLSVKEIKNESAMEKELLRRIEHIEDLVKTPNTSGNNTAANEVIHDPSKITEFLYKFRANTVFKWSSHSWDEKKYETIKDFIQELNKNKKEVGILFNYNRNLYNLLIYFLYIPKNKDASNDLKFGWPNLNKMKFGWQFPNNLLIDWCKDNFDNKNEYEIKKPFQFILPQYLRPGERIKDKEIKYFQDVVDVFKTEIQFRENYLYHEIQKLSNTMKDYEFYGIEELKFLDFYTYTPGILKAISQILDLIKNNETATKILFSYKKIEDKLIFTIHQRNSYPLKSLDITNSEKFIGGQLNAIAEDLFSLADFSIISKFISDSKYINGELKILYPGVKGMAKGKNINLIDKPLFEEVGEEVDGFTYKMIFTI